ncbi:MAG: hypothetical protein A3B34_01485 [Candidatus Sungbacteria bacterium RIFCSPLOWO2_01_FULL_54_21]|uniref:Uncharacterized protein n=1 Tax=Candidatus Sungbacteria bacterium RIFCSPLOWO2_01_FULL_54_21 TaxID=1802279 RepID=A0A1G2L4D9_9BACT|nr:MAG: hypothetical protein A2679_02290 [Candidatus Sungbacteria bacterium RIFCSPHIGHO2_01_FULL_54_26]OHA06563.1 MAG: hypothetical protein A3B34_01485 [Candidatus Sungbacteria bacterium RIFCSPLOWO2_01_FULL_54_21]
MITEHSTKGFGLIEIVIVTALVSGLLFVFSQAGAFALKLLRHEKETLEMTLLAEEGTEAVRSLRDESWTDNIDAHDEGADHYLTLENGKWEISHTPAPSVGQYERFVVIESVFRDAHDKIASSGAADPGTRKMTVRVTKGSRTVSLVGYLTDFQQYIPRPAEAIAVSYEGATNDADLIAFPSNNTGGGDPSQSFTTPASAIRVTKVSLLLRRATAAPSNIYAELRTAPDDTPAISASAAVGSASIPQGTAAWVDFVFPVPISLSVATSYTIRLRSIPDSAVAFSGSAGALRWWYLQSGAQGPYAGGIARRFIGSSGQGLALDQYDFGFRVYALQ